MTRVARMALVGAALSMAAASGALGLATRAEARLARTWQVAPAPVAIDRGAEAVARGGHLAAILCANCHGADLGGAPVFDDGTLAVIDAPNLTPGSGSATVGYGDADWVRAIRHGVARDGHGLLIMPAADFQSLSRADLAALVAYLEHLPPVSRETRPVSTTRLGRALLQLGAFGDILDAETIDHAASPASDAPADALELGGYLVATMGCRTCHGPTLTGGKDPNPDAPRGPDLTASGPSAKWTEQEFVTTMRTGRTPDGRVLSDFMPWKTLGRADDAELHAIWIWLRSR